MKIIAEKSAEEANIENVENVTETVKKPKIALVGIKKGAIAAKEAVTHIAAVPSKLFDSAVYGACYGLSYGAVFASLLIVKMVHADSLVYKGCHDGAEVAQKNFTARQEKQDVNKDSAATN